MPANLWLILVPVVLGNVVTYAIVQLLGLVLVTCLALSHKEKFLKSITLKESLLILRVVLDIAHYRSVPIRTDCRWFTVRGFQAIIVHKPIIVYRDWLLALFANLLACMWAFRNLLYTFVAVIAHGCNSLVQLLGLLAFVWGDLVLDFFCARVLLRILIVPFRLSFQTTKKLHSLFVY